MDLLQNYILKKTNEIYEEEKKFYYIALNGKMSNFLMEVLYFLNLVDSNIKKNDRYFINYLDLDFCKFDCVKFYLSNNLGLKIIDKKIGEKYNFLSMNFYCDDEYIFFDKIDNKIEMEDLIEFDKLKEKIELELKKYSPKSN